MSTRSDQRTQSPIQFLETASELVTSTWFYMRKGPKSYRFIYQTDVCKMINSCYMHLHVANSIKAKDDHSKQAKRGHLQEALGLLQAYEAFLDLIRKTLDRETQVTNKRFIDVSAWEKFGELISKERALILGVLAKYPC